MNRIKEIVIVTPAYGSAIVNFKDEIDVDCFFSGKQYKPSFGALEMLRKVARQMEVDFDFVGGSVTLRRRTQRALDVCPACAGKGNIQIGVYSETCSACHGTGTRK